MKYNFDEEEYVVPTRNKVGTVVWREVPTNPDCRTYDFRVPIEGYCCWDRHRGWSIDPSNQPATVVLITEISGVESVLLSTAYSIHVVKGSAFEWEEIHPDVTEILEFHNAEGKP